MVLYNIVVRIDNDKDFLLPIFRVIADLKKSGISVKFNIIGKVYSEKVYNKLMSFATEEGIAEDIHFTKESVRYLDLGDEYKKGFFINYSLGDVVGYSTMDAMSLGLKTILFNCDPDIKTKSQKLSFCNIPSDLFDLTVRLTDNHEETTAQIIEENRQFRETFFLNKQESELLLTLM